MIQKVFITLFFCLMYGFIVGQEVENQEPKKILLGGNINFNSSLINDYYNHEEGEVSLQAKILAGYSINPKIVVGVSLEYDLVDYTSDSPDDIRLLTPNLFVRFHLPLSEKFKFYIEPYVGRSFYLGSSEKKDYVIWAIGSDFGLLYMITPSMSLEINLATLSYHHQTVKNADRVVRDFNLKYDFQSPNFGLRFYL
jgi:hypothetical protein